MLKLDIYQVIEGTDNWPLIDTLEASTKEKLFDQAESKYGSNNNYHWTNPY
jgi:hypothetical protein